MQRILDFIIGAGILQGTFLAFYLWFKNTHKSSANRVLALLTGAFSINLLHSLLRTSVMPAIGWKTVVAVEPFQFLLGPLLFLFVRARIDGKKLVVRDGMHFIPFTVVLIFLTIQTVLSAGINIFQTSAFGFIFWGILFLQISGYFIACIVQVRSYNHTLTGYYSDIEKKKMNWLHIFMTILFVIYAGYLALFFMLFHRGEIGYFERLLSLLQSLAVFSLGTAYLFFDEPEPLADIKEDVLSYKKSSLTSEDLIDLMSRLTQLMDEKKPYLDPELSLPQLAAEAGVPRNSLSQVINEGFGKNFYDFVNAYRVEEVIRLMRSPEMSHFKILALAFEAGFNSKPAFNTSFRKITGQTPSNYKINMK